MRPSRGLLAAGDQALDGTGSQPKATPEMSDDNTEKQLIAWEQGQAAFRDGVSRYRNPYLVNSLRAAWNDGWDFEKEKVEK